jgi:anti-sigma factor RsiW
MSTYHALYLEWDAAYILGALTPTDRRAYETHLQDCELCRQAISEIASLPALLTAARPLLDAPHATSGYLEAAIAPPVDLVDRIQAREDRRRRTVRRRIALAAVGAAAGMAVAIGIPMALTGPAPVPTTVVLVAVVNTPLTATVSLEGAAWGTSIDMECVYPAGGSWPGSNRPDAYSLVVTDDAGHASQGSTWTAVPGTTIHLNAATAVPLDQIASIEIRSAAGDTILSAAVGS